MGLFDKLFGDNKANIEKINKAKKTFEIVTAYKPVYTTWRGQIYESELVRAAIDARARHFEKLGVDFLGAGAKTYVGNLRKRPNKWTTWPQFLYRVSTMWDVANNVVIVPTYDENMNRNGIWPLLPKEVSIVDSDGELYLRYRYGHNGQYRGACLLNECARLTRFQFENDFWGENNDALTPTMQVVDLQNQGIKEAIKNSAIYRFMAKVNNFIDDDDLKTKRENFVEANFKGDEDNGGLLLFPHDLEDIRQLDPQAYKVDPQQAEFIRTNVFNYFGVNMEILQNKAVGDALMAFYEGCIEPRAREFSEALKFMVYSEKEIANDNVVYLSTNNIQFMTMNDKKSMLEVAGDRGFITQTEGREILNLPPIEGGDVAFIRGEYYPTTYKLGEGEPATEPTTKEGGENASQE